MSTKNRKSFAVVDFSRVIQVGSASAPKDCCVHMSCRSLLEPYAADAVEQELKVQRLIEEDIEESTADATHRVLTNITFPGWGIEIDEGVD